VTYFYVYEVKLLDADYSHLHLNTPAIFERKWAAEAYIKKHKKKYKYVHEYKINPIKVFRYSFPENP